ncbi:MAG: AAA family ATPase, partial [Holophagales bacterium]|nr:AAA family ATPase [Holophagales bacterium]
MADWWPSEEEYTPGINKQKWLEMLKNTEIFDLDSLAIMKRMLDYGGSAACKELSQKYGKTVAFYNFGSVKLAKRILKETNCSLFPNEKTGKSRLWPILYQGADKKTDNLFIWRLRNELWEALEEMDLSNIPLYSELAEESSIEADDLTEWWPSEEEYTPDIDKQKWLEMLRNPDIFNLDSLVIMKRILDYGGAATCKQLSQKYGEHDAFYYYGSVNLGIRIHKETNCSVLSKGKEAKKILSILYQSKYPDKKRSGFLIWKLRSDLKKTLEAIDLSNIPLYSQKDANGTSENDDLLPLYTEANFLEDVFISKESYNTLKKLLERKKNVILTGPPGVGKTYAAKRLAFSIMGLKDEGRVKMVQFHQSYSYEDFVMGYRPNAKGGFDLVEGPFYQFCKQAADDADRQYFFIIDEINRGNLSKIFGELLMLIEGDKRGRSFSIDLL